MPSRYCSPESRFSKVFGTVLPVKCATRSRFAGLPGSMSLFTAQGMPVVGMLKALFLVALLGFGFVVASADAQTSRDYAVRDLRLIEVNRGLLRVEWREPRRKFRISAGYRITYQTDDGQLPNKNYSFDVPSGRDKQGRYLGNADTFTVFGVLQGRRYLVKVEPLTGVSRGLGVFPDTAVSKRITMTSRTFSGNFAGTVTEDGNSTATGDVTLSSGATIAQTDLANQTGTYGTFSLRNVSGQQYTWTYTLNNDDPDTNVLPQGATRFENFRITATRGRNTEQIPVQITVRGADDKPTVVAAPGDMGLERTIEDRSGTRITGTVASFADVDTPGNRLTPESSDRELDIVIVDPGDGSQYRTSLPGLYSLSTNYGRFNFVANGSGVGFWSYRLTNFNVPPGTSVTETFHLPAEGRDGLSTQTATAITITINGVDEDARFVPATSRRFLTEDADATADPKEDGTAKGRVRLIDPDTSTPPLVVSQSGGDPRGRKYKYGWFKIDAEGNWTYTLDDNDPDTQAAEQSQIQQTDQGMTITVVAASDPNISMGIDIIIQGKDDGGAVTGDLEESIREGEATVTGNVQFTSTDTKNGAMFETEVTPNDGTTLTTGTGTYGTFTITSAGAWTYTLDNSASGATDLLAGGVEMTDTFTVETVNDDEGMVTITIIGVNDAATFSGPQTGAVTEDATDNTATGTITVTDVDGANALKQQADQTGTYGSFSVDHSTGAWTYTLTNSGDNAQARATQALAGGATATETFTILAADDTPTTLTITITGVNDAAVFGTTGLTGVITEDADPNTVTGTVTSTDVDGTDNSFKTEVSPTTGTYGSLTITTAGAWTYTLDNSPDGATDLLDGTEDPKNTDAFTIMAADGTEATVTITITGVDDPATITGTLAGSVTEDDTLKASGSVTVADVDGANTFKTEVSPTPGTYGSLTITTAGAWTYTLDNDADNVQELTGRERETTDAFIIMAADGTEETVTITITGAIDRGDITGATKGSVTEDDTFKATASGTVTVDGDSDATFTAQTNVSGTYGTFNFEANGNWTYILNNSDLDTNALAGGDKETDTLEIATADDSARATLTITVTGNDDRSTIDEANLTGSVTEDGTLMASATVAVTDVDISPDPAIKEQSGVSGTYGTFGITSAGVWTYTLDNSAAAVQALRDGQDVTEAFRIETEDGAEAVVTITITGAADPREIEGTVTGSVTEDDEEASSARGRVTVTGGAGATFAVKAMNPPQSQTYGTFTIQPDGNWTYRLDNADEDTNELKQDAPATETITIEASLEGNTAVEKDVTITITGANDAARITGTLAGSVMEDGTLTASGSVTVADVDGDNVLKEQAADQTGSYGSLRVNHSAGSWTYTLDNDAAAVQALTSRARETDTFTILAADDTPATVTITITGATDQGSIVGATTGSVTEDDTLKATASGTVTVDGDSDATFTAQPNVLRTYGTFNFEANGNWTYTLADSGDTAQARATNALAGGAEVRDTLVIATANNSTTATLTITVTGNDDRSTIDEANLTGFVKEDVTLMASKTVKVTDVDSNPAAIKERSDVPGTYGTFGITSAGVWTYTLKNDDDAVQVLGDRQEVTEAFRINTEDGAEAVVTITITGTADTREIEGTVTGSVTEDDEEASSASGTVTVTENAGATFAVKATNPPQSYGTFTIQPDGNWTYRLDNADEDTNELKQDAKETETITIEASLEDDMVVEKDVTITITGVNDAATIGGELTGDITEDAVPNRVTGTATATDVDGNNSFRTEVTPTEGIYGSLTIAEDGAWTYDLNNADPDTNALTEGQEVTDSFTIKADDETETAVTITVTGAPDQDEIEGDVSGSVREAAGDEDDQAQGVASGRVRVADDSTARFKVQTDTATTYGTFSLTAEGVWTYRLDNDRGVTDALRQGRTVTEIITVEIDEATASDNTPRTATVTITVMGSEVGGDLTGSIREGSRTPVGGKLTTEQDYEIMNVDNIQSGEFGCLRVRSDGSWTYWLFGTDRRLCQRPIEALAQSGTLTALAAEQARMDVFMIEVVRSDGTVTSIPLTITIEEASAPVTRTVAVTGYLQGRAEVLLGKQPELGGFLKNLRSGITSEGQVSVDVRDGELMGFDGSFVRDDLWGALSVARSDQGSGKTDQIFGTLGYHSQVADATLVGLMLQFDQADGELDAGLGSIDGQGLLFGPYFAAQYQAQPWISPLTLEGRLLYGPTRNDVGFVDGGTGTFDTQRWLASFRLEGEVLLDYDDRAIRLIPHFDAGWVQDKVEAFTDSEEMQVAGQTIRFSEVALGSDIEVPVRFGQRDAMITGGLSLVSTREQSQIQNANKVSVSDTHGRLELGLGYRLANGIELEFGGSYDDVEGANSEDKFSLSFGLSNQF